MLEFLLALITVATVSALLIPLLGRRVETTARLDADLAIYRDQLAELARELVAVDREIGIEPRRRLDPAGQERDQERRHGRDGDQGEQEFEHGGQRPFLSS